MYALISQKKIDHTRDRSDLCLNGQHKLDCVHIDFCINHYVILRKNNSYTSRITYLTNNEMRQRYRCYQYIFSSPEPSKTVM